MALLPNRCLLLYGTKTFWQLLRISSVHNIGTERLEKGCKQRCFGDLNAVFYVESHDHEASVTVLRLLNRLLLADHTIYRSVIYGYLLIIVFHICVCSKKGVIRYGMNEWMYFKSNNLTTRLSESMFRLRMCGSLLE